MKKWLALLLTWILLFSLTACGSKDAVSEEASGDVAEEEMLEEDDHGYKDIAGYTYDEALAQYEANVEYDRSHFYLLRGDCYYCLDNDFVSIDNYAISSFDPLTILADNRLGFVSHGAVPIPRVENDDKVVASYARDIPNLYLYKLEKYGDAISLTPIEKGHIRLSGQPENAYEVEVTDSENNICEDWYDLQWGEAYRVSWYEDPHHIGGLQETTTAATCAAYVYVNIKPEDIEFSKYGFNANLPDRYDYEIEPSFVDNSSRIAEYDLSGLEPGIYRVGEGGGIIEIK